MKREMLPLCPPALEGESLSLGQFLSWTLGDLNMTHGRSLVLHWEKQENLPWQKVLLNFPVKEETSKWMQPVQGLSLSSSDSPSPKPPMAGWRWQISCPTLSVCVSVTGWGWGRRFLLPCAPVPALPDPWQVELCQRKCCLWCMCQPMLSSWKPQWKSASIPFYSLGM